MTRGSSWKIKTIHETSQSLVPLQVEGRGGSSRLSGKMLRFWNLPSRVWSPVEDGTKPRHSRKATQPSPVESRRNRAWASDFKSSLKLKIYSQALYMTRLLGCMRPLLCLWGSCGCSRPAVMPAVVIWNQFDPLTVKCPVCPQFILPYGGCMDMVLF